MEVHVSQYCVMLDTRGHGRDKTEQSCPSVDSIKQTWHTNVIYCSSHCLKSFTWSKQNFLGFGFLL